MNRASGKESERIIMNDDIAKEYLRAINTLGAPITINSVMGSSTDKSLTLNADSQANGNGAEAGETITIGAIGSGNEIGAVTLDGADGITLKGNIELSDTDGSNSISAVSVESELRPV